MSPLEILNSDTSKKSSTVKLKWDTANSGCSISTACVHPTNDNLIYIVRSDSIDNLFNTSSIRTLYTYDVNANSLTKIAQIAPSYPDNGDYGQSPFYGRSTMRTFFAHPAYNLGFYVTWEYHTGVTTTYLVAFSLIDGSYINSYYYGTTNIDYDFKFVLASNGQDIYVLSTNYSNFFKQKITVTNSTTINVSATTSIFNHSAAQSNIGNCIANLFIYKNAPTGITLNTNEVFLILNYGYSSFSSPNYTGHGKLAFASFDTSTGNVNNLGASFTEIYNTDLESTYFPVGAGTIWNANFGSMGVPLVVGSHLYYLCCYPFSCSGLWPNRNGNAATVPQYYYDITFTNYTITSPNPIRNQAYIKSCWSRDIVLENTNGYILARTTTAKGTNSIVVNKNNFVSPNSSSSWTTLATPDFDSYSMNSAIPDTTKVGIYNGKSLFTTSKGVLVTGYYSNSTTIDAPLLWIPW